METNSLQGDLIECLLSAQSTGNEVSLVFCYPESFTGFKGHFPGDPILPGVCILQSLRIGLERTWDQPLRLAGIVDAKFVSQVKPGDELLFKVRETARDNAVIAVRAKVTRKGARVAELTVKLEPGPVS